MHSPIYSKVKTVTEFRDLVSKYKKSAKVIAGGSDLLVKMKLKEELPKVLIDIQGIRDLDYIGSDDDKSLKIGALTTIHSVATSSLVRKSYELLAEAASKLGTQQIRNRATIGGNLCNAAPSADIAPPLIALGAMVKATDGETERLIRIDRFFAGPGKTILNQGEILAEIQIDKPTPQSRGVYLKHTLRRSLDLAIVGVAVLVRMDGEACSDIKISLGAVAPTPIRAKGAEEFIKGKKIESEILEKTGRIASDETDPINDSRSSADYRRMMVKVLVKRAILAAVEKVNASQ